MVRKSLPSAVTDHISGPADRVQQLRWRPLSIFPRRRRDVHVDDVGLRIEMIVPDVFEQHGAGHHLAGVAHQIFEQAEFARLQRNFLARASPCGTGGRVRDRRRGSAVSCAPAAPLRRPALRRAPAVRKSVGLRQIIVAAGAQALHAIVDLAGARKGSGRRLDLLRAQARSAKARPAWAACDRRSARRSRLRARAHSLRARRRRGRRHGPARGTPSRDRRRLESSSMMRAVACPTYSLSQKKRQAGDCAPRPAVRPQAGRAGHGSSRPGSSAGRGAGWRWRRSAFVARLHPQQQGLLASLRASLSAEADLQRGAWSPACRPLPGSRRRRAGPSARRDALGSRSATTNAVACPRREWRRPGRVRCRGSTSSSCRRRTRRRALVARQLAELHFRGLSEPPRR